MERQSVIGNSVINLVFSGKPKPETIEGLQEYIKEFTSNTGREKGWIDLSVDDRILEVWKVLASGLNSTLTTA